MKELTIEEKAKRYDEAIEKAKLSYHTGDYDKDTLEMLEIIFPELKESEDKKIRKELISYIKQTNYDNSHTWNGINLNVFIDWLEKQGEQKSIDDLTQQEVMDIAVAKCFEQGEQKPADKVEPKFKVGDHIKPIDKCLGSPRIIEEVYDGWYVTDKGTLYFEFEDNWELVEQKPVWSEKDVNALNRISTILVDASEVKNWWKEYRLIERDEMIRLTDFLKSLKDRYTWKPSNEHYELEEFAKIVSSNLTGISKAVQELFEAKYLQLTGNKMYGGFKD